MAFTMTAKFWADNKGKTVKDKGNLAKALKEFETAQKLAAHSKGLQGLKQCNALKDAIDEVESAGNKTLGACIKKVHDETITLLKGDLPKAITKARKDCEEHQNGIETYFSSADAKLLLKDRTLSTLWLQWANAPVNKGALVSYNFIKAAAKNQDRSVYDEYIKDGSPQQVNISSKLRSSFDEAAVSDDFTDAPWKKSIAHCYSHLMKEVGRGSMFNEWVKKQAQKN